MLDPVKFVEAHKSSGGVAPVEVQRMVKSRRTDLDRAVLRHDARLRQLDEADRKLDGAVESILSADPPAFRPKSLTRAKTSVSIDQ